MADPTQLETLEEIWQRVFRRSAIDAKADFFELGGNASLAAELFTEVNKKLSLELPPVSICNAPTIAALAASFDNPPSSGAAVLLKHGVQSSPIFFLHGVGSSVIDLVPLVRRMQSGPPIYGLEARGNDGKEDPLDRMDEIAQSFRTTICEIQPHGPYFLIGYSLGGLVALELARQLNAGGKQLALLLMLDSYPDRRYLSIVPYTRLLLQLARNRMRGSKNAEASRQQSGIHNRHGQTGSLVAALQRVKDANYRALRSYRPAFYDGEIMFVRAAVPSRFPADPVPVWSPLCRRFDVESVPGEHSTMLTTSLDPLASLIDKHVGEAYMRRKAPS